MNTNMYCNPIVQDNLKKLQHYGFEKSSEADTGFHLAVKISDRENAPPDITYSIFLKEISFEKDMKGVKRVLITAGPTREAIDPVRYITNHSTGKMGYALARNCMLRGAEVTLVTGPTSIDPPPFVHVIPVVSAKEMFDAVCSHAKAQDIIIKSAAVADYRPITVSEEKMKKSDSELSIPLERTDDILQYLEDKTRRKISLYADFQWKPKYAGKLQTKTGKEERRYDCCKQFQTERRRFRYGYQYRHSHHKRQRAFS